MKYVKQKQKKKCFQNVVTLYYNKKITSLSGKVNRFYIWLGCVDR